MKNFEGMNVKNGIKGKSGKSVKSDKFVKKILVLEPHLDDFEIGLSIWLKKQAAYKIEIHIVSFCSGRPTQTKEEKEERIKFRNKNLEYFKKEYPNIKIHNWFMGYDDTTLDQLGMGKLTNNFWNLFESFVLPYIGNFDFIKEVYFPQADLHPDHEIINKLGKIITRKFKGKVYEYIIQNSNYLNEYVYNTEIKTEYNFDDKDLAKTFIEVGIYPNENIYFQQLLFRQKGFDGKYISDKLNLIKDVFVASDKI